MANKHTVTVNGKTFTRTSKTHVYTHAVVALEHIKDTTPIDAAPVVLAWAGSYALAVKQVSAWQRNEWLRKKFTNVAAVAAGIDVVIGGNGNA